MIKTILFDLDGTLLPMDQDIFTKTYFGLLTKKASQYGYEAHGLIKTVWQGTECMVKNDGKLTNEEVFWNVFASQYGKESLKDKIIFDEFYENEFGNAKAACGYNPFVKDVINTLKNKYKLVLATNPIFPFIATKQRINWAGVDYNDFALCTTYENSFHSKPNLDYYRDLLANIGCEANECLMVGNDVEEDMVAKELGMHTFLITDCLINKNNKDINEYNHGNFNDLMDFINDL